MQAEQYNIMLMDKYIVKIRTGFIISGLSAK